MPLLDVSFMTTDPMLADTVAVRRRLNVIGNDGRVTAIPDQLFPNVVGVVTQQDTSMLMRAEDGQSFPKRIFFATKFKLLEAVQGNPGNQPDEVTWRGLIYTVESVLPYPQYGAGTYEVICEFRGVIPAVAQ